MKLLLDTHVLLWWVSGRKIAPAAARAISSVESVVLISAATVWEISIKRVLGKLDVPDDFLAHIDQDFEHLPITREHAWSAGSLPRHHDDPFDRMLIAQSISEEATIITRDVRFGAYDVEILSA